MLRAIRDGRKRYGLRRYLQRVGKRGLDRVLFSIDSTQLEAAFARVGIRRGSSVCVHSALSRLGHVVGGPETVIESLMEVIQTEGCILMPSFSTGGSMEEYLASGETYDVVSTPSRVGLMSEVFRQRADVQRSHHPTNSVAGWGRDVDFFLRDHELSLTPYGLQTPYGRLASRDDTYVLMLSTHIHSLLHHLQERVDFPNLFLPGTRQVRIIDENGRDRELTTKIMRPRIPYFIAIPSVEEERPDWAILHDFALMFPSDRPRHVRRLGYSFRGYTRLYQRRAELEQADILRTTRLGRSEIALLHVKPFLGRIEPELLSLIDRFRDHYDPTRIEALDLRYG